jgi:hypothetical protein
MWKWLRSSTVESDRWSTKHGIMKVCDNPSIDPFVENFVNHSNLPTIIDIELHH